jgi:hypothetical protein
MAVSIEVAMKTCFVATCKFTSPHCLGPRIHPYFCPAPMYLDLHFHPSFPCELRKAKSKLTVAPRSRRSPANFPLIAQLPLPVVKPGPLAYPTSRNTGFDAYAPGSSGMYTLESASRGPGCQIEPESYPQLSIGRVTFTTLEGETLHSQPFSYPQL